MRYLYGEEEQARLRDAEDDTERMMFAVNPEMWHELYAPGVAEGETMIIREPSTPEEFEEMFEEWVESGWTPAVD